MKLQTISAILSELYEHRLELSKSKFSGVYCVESGVYRVHVSKFIPECFSSGHGHDYFADIVNVINIDFYGIEMSFDTQSLWLTIKDSK